MGNVLFRIVGYFKIKHAVALIPICGFALYDNAFDSFSSILAVLRDTYPDVSVTTIQMIIAIPPMASIPGTLLSGFLAGYIHKKNIALFSLTVIFLGGMIPAVFTDPNIIAMFACSACIGIGQGLLHPLANAVACQTWQDDEDRSKALGFKQSFNYIGAAIISFVIGTLALSHWGNAFYVYLGIIPVIILTIVSLPRGELDRRLVSKSDRMTGLRELIRPRVIYLFALFFCAMMFMYGFHANSAMLIADNGLGTTQNAAAITSTVSVCSFVIALSYGNVVKALGRYTLVVGFALLGTGLLIASTGISFLAVVIGAVLFGLGTGIQQISTIYYISMTVDKRSVTMAVSIAISCISLGASVSPLVIKGIESAVFGTTSASVALALAGCGYFLLVTVEGIASTVRARQDRSK